MQTKAGAQQTKPIKQEVSQRAQHRGLRPERETT